MVEHDPSRNAEAPGPVARAQAWSAEEPYQPPQDVDPGVVVAEIVPDRGPEPPRIWTALLVPFTGIVAAAGFATVTLVAAALLDGGPSILQSAESLQGWLVDYTQTPLGLLVVVVPGQLAFLGVALLAAMLSPQQWLTRLRIGRGVLPLWTWLLFVVATPLIGLLSSEGLSRVVDESSPQLQMMEQMMKANASHFFLGSLLLVAVVPGVVEELLFRGYLQSRLVQRLPAVWAIGISAAIFAAAHLDPIHVLGVVPLGIWLGVVAWRADSVVPAVLCHAANNAFALVASALSESESTSIGVPWDTLSITLLVVSIPAFLLSLYVMKN